MGCDEVRREAFVCNHVGNVFVCPKGGFAADHPADAGDAVDDGDIVCPGWVSSLTSSGFSRPVGQSPDLVVVAHSDRVVVVEAHYMSVLYKDAGNAVDGSGDDVFIVKADVLGVRFDGVVEVCTAFRTQAEVPLAHCCSGVAFFFLNISAIVTQAVSMMSSELPGQCRYSSVARDTCLSAGRSGKGCWWKKWHKRW